MRTELFKTGTSEGAICSPYPPQTKIIPGSAEPAILHIQPTLILKRAKLPTNLSKTNSSLRTLCSRRMHVSTCRQASTPNSSKGRCNGKSTKVKRDGSGRAKVKAGCNSCGRTSTSTRFCPATGMGERSSRYIQASISRKS